jgi:hypothetical protein
MAVNSVLPPYPNYRDLDGEPLEAGFIYIGEPGFEARSTPKASFFDEALTIPTGTETGAAIRTRGGFPLRNGAPANIYVNDDFSITVTDRNGVLIYTALTNQLVVNQSNGGQILAFSGTVGAPGLSFAASTGTGLSVVTVPGQELRVSVAGSVPVTFTQLQTFFNAPISGLGFSESVRANTVGRNLIINGQGRINQRGYVSGAATIAANQYTLDRWRVVVSGQSLTFTGSDARRTMTAPAGGVEQVVEGENITAFGNYVINFSGSATCRVNGVIRSPGVSFTLPANTNVTVRFESGTFTDVQLEQNGWPSVFEYLPLGVELSRCQRYYFADTVGSGTTILEASAGSNRFLRRMTFPVTMRAAPTPTFTAPTYTNCSALSIGVQATNWFERVTVTATGAYNAVSYTVAFDAEL